MYNFPAPFEVRHEHVTCLGQWHVSWRKVRHIQTETVCKSQCPLPTAVAMMEASMRWSHHQPRVAKMHRDPCQPTLDRQYGQDICFCWVKPLQIWSCLLPSRTKPLLTDTTTELCCFPVHTHESGRSEREAWQVHLSFSQVIKKSDWAQRNGKNNQSPHFIGNKED